jgi:DDE superfamily endonuclease
MDVLDNLFTDDDDGLALAFLLSLGVFSQLPEERNPSHFEQRLAWDDYSTSHTAKGTFDIRLRMPLESFNKLLGYIKDELLVEETKAKVRGGSITPELCLYCTIRWLAGGSYLDISDVCGISKSSFYRVVWKTITAICKAPELKPKFPKTDEEIQDAISGFASISTGGVINNCVGVVDGYLLRIKVPNQKEAKNVKSFFSGHYQCYGVNVQAVADHHCRFLFIAFAGPGVMSDKDAFGETTLRDLVEGLPFGICIIGDAAYCPSEHLVPVYQGLCKTEARYDNFNYYASQVRIRIEMAFGMMSMKWGILNHPVGCSLANLKWLIQAVGRLHNYCINERLARDELFLDAGIDVPAYLPTVPHDVNGDPIDLGELFKGISEGHSHLREHMAARVEQQRLKRQGNNGLNRKEE